MFRRALSSLLILVLLFFSVLPAGAESFADFYEDSDSTSPEETAQPETEEGLDTMPEENLTDYPTLRNGDRDEDGATAYVVILQSRLIELGYLATTADGVFGQGTEDALKDFQQSNGLTATGIADAVTQQKLYADISTLVMGNAVDTSATGNEAKLIQQKLGLWGFFNGKADGVLGSESQKAISRFKTYVMTYCPPQVLTPEPTATVEPTPEPTSNPDELPMVNDVIIPTPEPSPTPFTANSDIDATLMTFINGDTEFPIFRNNVQSGDNGEEVYRIQRRLNVLKYLYNVDGEYGMDTVRALMYFQTKNGLSATGIADEATQRALFSDSAVRSEEYVAPYKVYVDVSEQRVYVFGWDGTGYTKKVRKMKCSTGKKDTPTPLGTFQATGPSSQGEWYWFEKYHCYAKWGYRIVGGILFHSVVYNKNKQLVRSSVSNLGRRASHGCIRLSVEDADWIYHNVPAGSTIVIQN